MFKNNITTEDIKKWELIAIKDAIGCELPLSNNMLKNECSDELRAILEPLTEEDRNYHITAHIKKGTELNIFGDTGDIKIVIGEIETQFEDPNQELAAPDEHVINGDLVYTRFDGCSFEVDLETLKQEIKDHA